MQNARIFFVDDEELVRRIARRELEAVGHKIVLEATNLEEVLEIVKSSQLREKRINVAIIDGRFPDKAEGCFDFNGPKASKAIQDLNLGINIIAFSSLDLSYGLNVIKDNNSWKNLQEAIGSF